MKRACFLVLLFVFLMSKYIQSQVVSIPDEVFKNKLIEYGVDLNNDGEIDYEEALNISELYLEWDAFNDDFDKKIKNISGIEYFENLEVFYINYNRLDTIDLNKNKKLRLLSCDGNEFKELILSENSILEELFISKNALGELELPTLEKLKYLDVSYNELSNLNIPKLFQLEYLSASGNNMASIPFDSMPNLKSLTLYGNNFPIDHTFEVINNKTLKYLSLKYSNLAKLNIASSNIQILDANGCNLSEIYFENNDSLKEISIHGNKLSEFNVQEIPNMINISIGENLIDTLDLHILKKLKILNCGSLYLKCLNLPSQLMSQVNCNNSSLEYLDLSNSNIKYLRCNQNSIDSLNTCNLKDLVGLECDDNNMSKLVFNNPKLKYLHCSKNNYIDLDFTSLTDLQSAVIYEVPYLEQICVWAIPYAPASILLDRHDVVITDCVNNTIIDAGINTVVCEDRFKEDVEIYLGTNPSVSIEYKDLYWTIDYQYGDKKYDENYFLDNPKIVNPIIINSLGYSDSFYAILNVLGVNDTLYKDSINVVYSKYICTVEDYYMDSNSINYLDINCVSHFPPYNVVWSPDYCMLDSTWISPMVWPIVDTTYFYTIIDDVGCVFESSIKVHTEPNNILRNSQNTIKVFPNPVLNELTIEGINVYNKGLVIEIFNSNSMLIKTCELNESSSKVLLNELKTGYYFYRIIVNKEQMYNGSFVKY